MAPEDAAGIIIGTEVLTAKVEDRNGALLIRRLREQGVPLRSLEFVHDDVDHIVDAVQRARKRARHVFTSGGIGPTHDDVTVKAVALALGRPVVRLPQMEALIREHATHPITPETLRLADAPEGATLIALSSRGFPVLEVERIYLLPGVPQFFAVQLETVLRRLTGVPVHLQCLYMRIRETELAAALDRISRAHPHVAIGSYPEFDVAKGYLVKLTFEHTEELHVRTAIEAFRAELTDDAFVDEPGAD